MLGCVRLFATPWAVARQVPLSMGFSRHVNWCGLPCPSPEKVLTGNNLMVGTSVYAILLHHKIPELLTVSTLLSAFPYHCQESADVYNGSNTWSNPPFFKYILKQVILQSLSYGTFLPLLPISHKFCFSPALYYLLEILPTWTALVLKNREN